MKKLLCLLLTLLLIHPALAEDALDALDAPDAASLLSCADGTVLAVSPDLRVLRRDSAGDWALILSAEQISAACPPRFMPDAANALLLPGRKWCIRAAAPARHERANRRAVPDRGDVRADAGVRGFSSDGQRNDRAVGAPFPPRAPETTLYAAFFKQFRDTQHLCAFAGGPGRLFCFWMRRFAS